MKHLIERHKMKTGLVNEIFPSTERRYTFNSWSFILARESINLTSEQFAEKIGWSKAYQYKIENKGIFSTISKKVLDEIFQVFERYRHIIEPRCFTGCVVESFAVNPKALRKRREERFTTREFSILAGWSTQYQYKLELGKVKHVSKDVRDMIINLLTKGENEND